MASNEEKNVPEFRVSQIIEIPGREKAKFYEVGVGFTNGDESINIMTVHGTFRISKVKPREDKNS